MPNVGPMEIILLLGLALLLFGAKRLPEIGRSMGKSMREFKDSVSNVTNEIDVRGQLELPAGVEPSAATRPREHDTV
jgi:sec-independent protein translocase protein TatA